jgi:hypothetical protein
MVKVKRLPRPRGDGPCAYQLLNRTNDALAEARIAVNLNPYDAYTLYALGNKSDQNQYSSASMIVMTRSVTEGSDGSGE